MPTLIVEGVQVNVQDGQSTPTGPMGVRIRERAAMMYDNPPLQQNLTQADIIDGCPIFALKQAGEKVDLNSGPTRM